jgi:hypothetical protein
MTWFCGGPGSLYRACGIGDIHYLFAHKYWSYV